MKVIRNLGDFVVTNEDSLRAAFNKMNSNKHRIVFVVSESGEYQGVLTDGDFRRWLLENDRVNLQDSVEKLINRNSITCAMDAEKRKIESLFKDGIDAIPLLDKRRRLTGIALKSLHEIKIGSDIIGPDSACYLIAEIGNNHNGSVDAAKKLVDLAKKAGANCAKFQMRNLKSLYRSTGDSAQASFDLGTEYTLDLLNRFNLNPKQLFEVFDYSKSQGITPLCTPWDFESLEALESYGVEAYKIASADLTNHDLLVAVAKTGKPIILSTGMSTETEIIASFDLLKELGAQFIPLLCNSTYPTPYKDINLNYMLRLKELGDGVVGYSGHERGFHIPIAAVALGAKLIEKHFTIDRGLEGSDHKISLLPDEFARMTQAVRDLESAMGTSKSRIVTQGERLNRESLAKSLFASMDIPKGATISQAMIAVSSPGNGLQPNKKSLLVGAVAKRSIKAGEPFFESDIADDSSQPRPFSFKRSWGIPVRFHDLEDLTLDTNPDLLEFHFSYRDLELNPAQFIRGPKRSDLVIHAPELFENDHVLDLASDDGEYREQSIKHLQRVVAKTLELRSFFNPTGRTRIVVNCGGFSFENKVDKDSRASLYANVADALKRCSHPEIEFLPQTMPPFPWHFGGQRYHNLFVDPDEIVRFCEENGFTICFDVAHSKLACNNAGWSLHNFVEAVGQYVSHIHVVDAAGVDDEGLQIGEGEIDFAALASHLNHFSPNASFIPEIWQGHKNRGEGFWRALTKLEGLL